MQFLFDPINIFLIITGCLNLFLGAIIFYYGRNERINLLYGLNIVAIISWILTMIVFRASSAETSMFFVTALYIAPTFIASTFLYFTYIFPSTERKYLYLKSFIIFLVNAGIIFMIGKL